MALSAEYLQQVIAAKDLGQAREEADRGDHVVSWAICDGALVIFDCDDPPAWFRFERDDDGNSVPGGPAPPAGDIERMTIPSRPRRRAA